MNKTILLVEDDDSIAEVIQIILEGEGYVVISDNTGELVLNNTLQVSPDMAIVDYLLPGTNGAEVVSAIKKSPLFGHIPIIMMSANTEAELRQIAKESGVKHVMPKPFDVDNFLKKVRSILPV